MWLLLIEEFAGVKLGAGTLYGALAVLERASLVDLVLIFGLAIVLLRGADPATRRPLTLLAAGGGCFIVADVYLGYVRSHGQSTEKIDAWHRADLAMYGAKRAGAGGLACYDPTMADERQASLEAAGDDFAQPIPLTR